MVTCAERWEKVVPGILHRGRGGERDARSAQMVSDPRAAVFFFCFVFFPPSAGFPSQPPSWSRSRNLNVVQQDPAAGPRISFIHALDEARRVRHELKRPLQNLTVQRDKETAFVLAEAPGLPPTPGGRKQG